MKVDGKQQEMTEQTCILINWEQKPFMIDGHKINISISIGISFYPKNACTLEDLITTADKAMYIAKKDGTKIVSYDSAIHSK